MLPADVTQSEWMCPREAVGRRSLVVGQHGELETDGATKAETVSHDFH